MATTDSGPDYRLKFQHRDEILDGHAETELKRRYGRGIYVNDIREASTGELVISLGNTIPKNVSDSREQDRVLQFINIRDIYTLRGEPTGGGYYIVELPDRDEVYNGFVERRAQIIDRLDYSMAKAIYENVFELTPVKNQLNAIIQIIRWVRERSPLSIERIEDAQGSENTAEYLRILSDLGFLRIEDNEVYPGEKMDAADLIGLDGDDYVKTVVGDIVQAGYNVLQDQLNLRMLSHYPKYSNAYYYSALQRNDPDLWLDIEAISQNYEQQYGDDADWLVVNDKLNELADTNVIQKDGEYVQAKQDVYNQVAQEAPVY